MIFFSMRDQAGVGPTGVSLMRVLEVWSGECRNHSSSSQRLVASFLMSVNTVGSDI